MQVAPGFSTGAALAVPLALEGGALPVLLRLRGLLPLALAKEASDRDLAEMVGDVLEGAELEPRARKGGFVPLENGRAPLKKQLHGNQTCNLKADCNLNAD